METISTNIFEMDRLKSLSVLICFLWILAASSARNMRTQTVEDKMGKMGDYSSTGGKLSDEMEEIFDLCNSTFPTPKEYLIYLNETGEFPANATRVSKCYLNCVFMRLKIFDEMGNVNATVLSRIFEGDEEEMKKSDLYKKCWADHMRKHYDHCEQAYMRVSCLTKEIIANEKKNMKKDEK